jgi:hypothetical protein
MRVTDKSEDVKQLKQRHAALTWWLRMQQEQPWDFTLIPTPARLHPQVQSLPRPNFTEHTSS